MELKYDTIGKIIAGENCGWLVKIVNDTLNTGGYYVYEFESIESENGFDTWLENETQVKGYIYENEWKINWNWEFEDNSIQI